MKNGFCLLMLAIYGLHNLSFAQQNIYLSGTGSDNSGNGNSSAPFKSFERALELVNSPGQVTYNLVLKASPNEIQISKNGTESLTWTESGSQQHPINVYSENETASVKSDKPSKHMIFLENVQYVNFKNIKFLDATLSFQFDNADHCEITQCQFLGSSITVGGGTGAIWLGKREYQTSAYNNSTALSTNRSEYNTIRDNVFSGHEINDYDEQHLYHAIYLSHGSYGNKISQNTMKMGLKIGSGIQMNHGYMDHNVIKRNFVYKTFGSQTDKYMNSRHGINFQWEDSIDEVQTINDNRVTGNFLYANTYREYVYPNNCDPNNSSNNSYRGPQLMRIRKNLCANNTVSENLLTYGNEGFLNDPLWLNYEAEKMTNRVVNGDFDGDSIDDIAVLYDDAPNSSMLQVWLSKSNTFETKSLETGWWNTSGYHAQKTTGRVVSGDFDGNGYDDIGAFYDYGVINGKKVTKLHLWLSSGTHFTYQNSNGWWNSATTGTGYDANQITDRVISGDFDGNGFDDIGAFYDYGNNDTRLHMWLSTGSNFSYQNSNGWWEASGYNADKISGKVVAGDFDGNGFDDIAAFYDYGNNNTRLHMWLSSGSFITYQNSNGWWNSATTGTGYNANQITGKVVAGDFDGNGFDDIGAFYDYGNANTRMHTWLSSGSHITYQNSNGWWDKDGYDSAKITGRVVSGDFNNDGKADVSAFYDYTQYGGALRSHVWHSKGNGFEDFNSSLGYPWKEIGQGNHANRGFLAISQTELSERSGLEKEQMVKIYPNPTTSKTDVSIAIEPGFGNILNITIYDLTGKRIKQIVKDQSTNKNNKITIDKAYLQDLSPGVYLLKINGEGTVKTFKIIKK